MRHAGLVALFVVAMALAACGGGGGETTSPDTASCEPGSEGCECLAGDVPCRGENLFCAAGMCRMRECTVGDADCACFANFTCSKDADGAWLVCADGLCRAASCPQGEQGCGCFSGGTCNSGLYCKEGENGVPVCDLPECTQGDVNCGCLPDRTCNAGADGEPLVCQDRVCVKTSCTVGAKGCPCRNDYGCDANLLCGQAGTCVDVECTKGTAACGCLPDGSCKGDDDLYCNENGKCQKRSCAQGTRNCGCNDDYTCTFDDQDPLVCSAGTCVPPSCASGSTGCGCLSDNTCDDDLLVCENGVCRKQVCSPGTDGCTCKDGGECNTGLVCKNMAVCVSNLGYTGGACYPNQTCEKGAACQSGTCVGCSIGGVGCSCYDNGSCNAGLACTAGTCNLPSTAAQVAKPACFTPCTGGVLGPDGVWLACDSDGLMQGCVGTATCQQGSCVPPGQAPPSCETDVDCPDHQMCIAGQGLCASTCLSASDCQAIPGTVCHRHVCRVPCNTTDKLCDAGQTCRTVDGQNGFCFAYDTAAAAPTPAIVGGFTLSAESVAFSNTLLQTTVDLVNDSPQWEEFTIEKVQHTLYGTDSTQVITESPLYWLKIGANGTAPVLAQTQSVKLDGGGATTLTLVLDASKLPPERWEGVVEVKHATLGVKRLTLTYSKNANGRWAGEVLFFANFDDKALQAWLVNKTATFGGDNALLTQWSKYRNNSAGFDFAQFDAILTAVISGSWAWPTTLEACNPGAPDGKQACALTASGSGTLVLTSDKDARPVPSGVSRLPMAMNLKGSGSNANLYAGRIETSEALQYAGYPAISLTFEHDPATYCAPNRSPCLVFLSALNATVAVGGRYATTADDPDCEDADEGLFVRQQIPWLVPGFDEGTTKDDETGMRYRYECRNQKVPYDAASDPDALTKSVTAARSNPIPDGQPRVRTITLIDGVLVERERLIVLFKESFPSFLGATDSSFTAYGLMLLHRTSAQVREADYVGTTPNAAVLDLPPVLSVGCDAATLSTMLAAVGKPSLTASSAPLVARALVTGQAPAAQGSLQVTWPETVHYFCEDTGLFDGGPKDKGSAGVREACPAGSRVTYFTLTTPDLADADDVRTLVADMECQDTGRCQDTLNDWKANGTYDVRVDPLFRCTDDTEVYCDTDRLDLRSGKTFFSTETSDVADQAAVLNPLLMEVDQAFRYKTKFRTRFGKNIGFTPQMCVENSDAIPYCYDPKAIEAIRHRVDCAASLFVSYGTQFDSDTYHLVRDYLERNFASLKTMIEGNQVAYDGFEKLYAELLIMQGDDRYTAAFASRFDLAGSNAGAFEGELFEPNGIHLGGAAGYEMVNLYQAAQYYQLVLDRFFNLSKVVWRSFELAKANPDDAFVTVDTVAEYFGRLVRASTQEARTWTEIAKRYQAFNEPDLARGVIERAYTATYLESVVMARLLLRIVDTSNSVDRPQILKAAENAQLAYQAALLEMREGYAGITDNISFFGFAPDYIPFPALEVTDHNAFEKSLTYAKQQLAVAAGKEEKALANNKSYDTDEAAFQSELVQIRNNYENQLAEVCGTFEGPDGKVYPAIPKYAYILPGAALLGDPCGYMGNGSLHEAMAAVDLGKLDFSSITLNYKSVVAQIDIENKRLKQQCQQIDLLADFRWKVGQQTRALKDSINDSKLVLQGLSTAMDVAKTVSNLGTCIPPSLAGPGNCLNAAVTGGVFEAAATEIKIASLGAQAGINDAESNISAIQANAAKFETSQQCTLATIDSQAKVASMALDIEKIRLDALKAQYSIQLALSRVDKLRNQATRLIAEQTEQEQLSINLEAAKVNPNVRIYKNDAILTADRTFEDAVRAAYKATRVFEYYTSTSYAHRNDLFLVRMVEYGDKNLETFVSELEDAFLDFQEQYGLPDSRVAILSVRDDILRVERVDEFGKTLSEKARVDKFRQRLREPDLLDENGYIALPFSTGLKQLSPLTRNHKLEGVEVEVVGGDVGDPVGRVYLRPRGTGVVKNVEGVLDYFLFPERTAVVNTFFNGNRTAFSTDLYRNRRLVDRPFVNTHWELVINHRDEEVNEDIDLGSLTDIRVYLYYSDFTQL